MGLFSKPLPDAVEIEVAGAPVRVDVRVSDKARAYRLALPHRGGVVLTVPRHGRWSEAEAFLLRQRPWLAARLKRQARPQNLGTLETLPLRGEPHLVIASGSARGRVTLGLDAEGQRMLSVPGLEAAHRERRLLGWLKGEALSDLEACVGRHAPRLGVAAGSITLRSQSTRWGSCSSRGSLNFNWRLILAPPFVLDYVAAHEVAHLVEMNHSPAFWAAVERTLPDMARGRAWLKAHGRELMAFQG